ncbi:Cyb2 cytochrome b2 precursor protein [Candida orthopsilosis Co 90-125]|uniref:L-lactate dehydrogenase (cytochrome) n=1 Tax=Candida orthopsilosis (strain 90-125) TaxID=1136231 RepID=H8X4R1_CANO9|nr:Cyb2 cytochrome b2 precursor protein [Candida orthopsilosis Co 90-125]CCG23003.1 Cyb2 cytochrome b2 precursor protein [Candida orthopsilosis Co 90-125]
MVLALSEVAKHNTKQDCWVIIHDKAYDLSDFVDEHPGGSAIILKYAGKDATKAFDPIHPSDTLTKYLAPKYHKGEVEKKVNQPVKKVVKKKKESAEKQPQQSNANSNSNVVDEFDVEYDEQDGKDPLPVPSQNSTDASDADEEEEVMLDEDGEPIPKEEVQRLKRVENKPDLGQIYNLNDFEFVARHTMEKIAWAYYSSGCDDEITMRENHLSYQRIFFKPRVMVDVTNIDLSTTMLGTNTSAPFYVTATALGRLGHPDGEKVLTRGCAKQDIIQMIPTLASCSFDEIVDQATDKQTQWFQLYVNSNKEISKKLIQHAEKRGIKGLFITVDAPQLGRREKDMRSKDVTDLSHVQGEGDEADRSQGAARAISSFIDTALNWKDLKWFKSITKMPIILKGVQCVEDAIMAAEHGCQGVILSNHGGRQLEFSRAPIEVLIELMPILRERGLDKNFEVYVDGGVRRATDILKAICLGAKGVGIGRPFLYAMSTYGDDGVVKAMQILKDEMIMNMRLLGVTSIDQLNEQYVDVRNFSNRFVPEDKLFRNVYQPLISPPFKEAKF